MTLIVDSPSRLADVPAGATWVIDNYDSFTWNLVQLLGALGQRPVVVRNDVVTAREIRRTMPARIILSPGPGDPRDPARTGVCRALLDPAEVDVPLLGVCLGHQLIVAAFGGRITRAAVPMHGKVSLVHHDGAGLFSGMPRPFEAMRYHSLIAAPESIPACLRVTARTDDHVIMGVEHATRPLFGVQFHPESIGTTHGRRLIEAFVALPPGRLMSTEAPTTL